MCVLEHNFFLCSHYKSTMILCEYELECRKQGTPPELIRYKLHFRLCESVHCSMWIYWKLDNGEVNCATWALNTDCNTSYQDREDPYSGDGKGDDDDDDTEETVIENSKQVVRKNANHVEPVTREEAVRAIRWMERRYPAELASIQQQVRAGYLQGEQPVLTKVVTKEEQEEWISVEREWQPQQAQQAQQAQLQAHAQQYAYQHQHPNHYQLQHYPDQYYPQSGYHPNHPQPMLPSSSSGHYLPPPNPTLYLTASGDYDGHNGHAGVPGVPGVVGLLTAPPSADEAHRSKSSSSGGGGSSSSRSKDASKHGKTEKKSERHKDDKEGRGGKDKKRR